MKHNEKNVILPYAKYRSLTEKEETKVHNEEEEVNKRNKTTPTPQDALMTYLQQISTRWNMTDSGELAIDGKTIRGTNVKELIKFMRGQRSKMPNGWKQFSALFKNERHLFTKVGLPTPVQTKTSDTKNRKYIEVKRKGDEILNHKLPPPPPSIYIRNLNKRRADKVVQPQKKGRKYSKVKWITLP